MLDSGGSPEGWAWRWRRWRNRWIGDSGFQRRMLANPLTRPKARAEARALFDLTSGFVYSQVAAALVESGLLEALAAGPLTLAEAAGIGRLPAGAARTLLDAAGSLDLTEEVGGRWLLGQRGAALAGMPGLADMIRHHNLFYADLADPLAMLRREGETRLSAMWDYDESAGSAEARAYSGLMSATQPMVAAQALAAYDFARHRRLLDIGGGEGRFLAAVGAAHPHLGLGLFDRPAVLDGIDTAGSLDRHPGDFRRDPLPGGYDLHSLVRVLHDHDDEPARALLAASRQALAPGGRLLVVEPMAVRGRAPEGHAYFGFYLAAMRSGRPRTAGEIGRMLREAGFRTIRHRPTPLPLVARCVMAEA